MDRLKALAVFKSVVEQGSFTRAAEALDLSPAAVTRMVQELEALLAARLLHRTTRRVALTTVGQAVLERARNLLADFEELASIGVLNGSEAGGTVRLVAPAWLGRSLLGGVAAAYLASCPKVSLDLRMHAGGPDQRQCEADLVLCREGEMKPSWVARRVAQVKVSLCASPAYLARRGLPISPMDLQRHDSLAGGTAHAELVWHLKSITGGETARIGLRPVLHSNQPETLMGAALHGAGIASLPDLLTEEEVSGGRLLRLLPGWSAEQWQLHVGYESRQHQPLSVRRLIDALASALAHEQTPQQGGTCLQCTPIQRQIEDLTKCRAQVVQDLHA